MRRGHTWAVWTWALVLSIGMLGPALAPGFVLTYDMVWVPHLAPGRDALGLGDALPRAVPSDLVVALGDDLIPGMLLQKVVLLGSLTCAGAGVAALVPGLPWAARGFATALAIWNPFVIERLVIGHWPVLMAYAAMPWVLLAMRQWGEAGTLPRRLGALLVLGSLSASAGLATAVAALAAAPRGRRLVTGVLLAGANAPWLVSGVLHRGSAYSDPASAAVFATSGEGLLPAPLAALTLGGIWNAEVVPGSRLTWLPVVGLLVVGFLAVVGLSARDAGRSSVPPRSLVVCWVFGYGVACVSALAPGAMAWITGAVPGGGLLRDGSRLLGLCVPLIAVLAAYGVSSLLGRTRDRVTRLSVAGMLLLVPTALMPDAAWGQGGRLRAVDYPAGVLAVEDMIGRLPAGDVLVLPFSSFRAPVWNDGRTVLDPLPRLVGRDAVSNDELSVDGTLLRGEDPRAAAVRSALSAADPEARASGLASLGIVGTVTDRTTGDRAVPEISGAVVAESDEVRVMRVEGVVSGPPEIPLTWRVLMAVAWSVFAGCLVGLPLIASVRRRRSVSDHAPR